jgi:hypothetical protein
MSGYTQTTDEVLFASVSQGTQLATFTAEASLHGTLGIPVIPGGWALNNGATGKCIKVKASGRMGSTTSGPTMLLTARLIPFTSAFAWSASGITAAASAATTMAVSQTLVPWFLDMDIVLQNLNPGATSVISTMGEWRSNAFVSPFAAPLPAPNVTPVVSTFDSAVSYALMLSVTCGTSNAANLIHMSQFKMYGEN